VISQSNRAESIASAGPDSCALISATDVLRSNPLIRFVELDPHLPNNSEVVRMLRGHSFDYRKLEDELNVSQSPEGADPWTYVDQILKLCACHTSNARILPINIQKQTMENITVNKNSNFRNVLDKYDISHLPALFVRL
jgi:hypothetical protein